MKLVIILACSLSSLVAGKTFTKCGLAKELVSKGVPKSDIPDWVCMAQYESALNTSATNSAGNSRDSTDYGIFQINSYWNCDPKDGRNTKNGCGHPCSDYMDSDLTDDVACIKKLKREHGGTFGFSVRFHTDDRRGIHSKETWRLCACF